MEEIIIENFTFKVNEDADRVYITDKENNIEITLDFGTLTNERFVCIRVKDIEDNYEKNRLKEVFYGEVSLRKD